MKKNSKKLFLNNTAIETRRTTSKTAGGGLANYAIELGQWIENRIKDNTIKVGEQHVVDDIATRDDLFDVTKGDVAYVVDASADANVGSGAALYVYDGSDWKRIAKFESLNVTSSNITEGTLNPATTDRTVDMGTFDLDVTGTGHKTLRADATGNVYSQLRTNGLAASIGTYNTGSSVAVYTTDSLLKLDANGSAEVTLNKLTGNLHLYSYSGNYKLGATPTSTPKDLDSLTTPVYGLQINSSTGDITKVNKDAQFLADSQINPAISGHPTNAEIMTFLTSLTTSVRAGNLGRFFYYTGTDSPVDDYTHAYYMTGDGLLFKISSSEISNITEGTLNQATSNRTVDMGGNTLDIIGTNVKRIINTNSNITTSLIAGNGDSTVSYNAAGVSRILSATNNGIDINNNQTNYVKLHNSGSLDLYSGVGSYRIGVNSSSLPPVFPSSTSPYVLSLNPNNGVMYGLTSGSYFISDSSLSPASSGAPTFTEVETYVNGLGAAVIASLKNRVLYYTGTDTSTDAYTYSYYFSGDGRLFVLDKPKEVELDFFALTVTSGSASLTAVDNGITSNLFYPAGYSNSDIVGNFAISWDNTNSSAGQFTAQLKANDGTIITTLTAPDNTFGGTFGNNTTTPFLNVRKGLYVEFSNITGTVKSPMLKFTITRV